MNLVGYDSPSQIMVVVVCVVLRHHLLTFSTDDETLLAPSRVAYSLQKTKSSSVTSDCVAAVFAFILDEIVSEVHQCVLPQVSAECVKEGPSVRRMA